MRVGEMSQRAGLVEGASMTRAGSQRIESEKKLSSFVANLRSGNEAPGGGSNDHRIDASQTGPIMFGQLLADVVQKELRANFTALSLNE